MDMVLEKFTNEKIEKQDTLKLLIEERDAITKRISISEKMIYVNEPDREMVNMLIEKVAVDKSGGIDIHWKFKTP